MAAANVLKHARQMPWSGWDSQYELDALVSELLKDRAYFDSSGGGVTASGGEPTLQASFLSALFERLKSAGVHTALDTCGLCSRAALEIILPHTDLVLFDLKEMDPARHRQYTGSDNTRILENLRWVSQYCDLHGLELWVRTPLIPGATAREENIAAAGAFLADLPGKVSRWELCAFNNLCRDKYLAPEYGVGIRGNSAVDPGGTGCV
jgi:pyruvate formate lyase activating enzyme